MWESTKYADVRLGGLLLRSFRSQEAISNDEMDLMGDSSEDLDAQLLTYFCKAGIFANKNQRMASS